MCGPDRTGAPAVVPSSAATRSLTQIAVIIGGAGLARLQLPLNQVDEVLGVIGPCNLLLGGRQDLAWEGHEGGDGRRRRGREERPAGGGDWEGFQKSGSRKTSVCRVVEEDT